MILKIFNYISYFRYVAYLWGAYVAFPEIIERTNNIIANVGFGLFLFGIGIALKGFKDSDRKFTNGTYFDKLSMTDYSGFPFS